MLARHDVASNVVLYYIQNRKGDITHIVDGAGNIVNEYTYDIWGNPLTASELLETPFRYSGEYWDSTTGLQYLRARWYDPSVGRFINEDPYQGDMTNPLSQNRYSYVHNNPLIYVDPSGHKPYVSKVGNGKVNLYFSQKIVDNIETGMSSLIPFVGSWIVDKARGVSAFTEDDFNQVNKYFLELSIDIGISGSTIEKPISNSDKFVKTTGRILAVLNVALTGKELWDNFKYDDKIDKIIQRHLIGTGTGDPMLSNNRVELLAKYLYATERITELLEEEKVTHISTRTRNINANYFDPVELELLKRELNRIKIK